METGRQGLSTVKGAGDVCDYKGVVQGDHWDAIQLLILTVGRVTQIYICDFVWLVLIRYYGCIKYNHEGKLRK